MRPDFECDPIAPILVLGLGNRLLADDGAGLELLAQLRAELVEEERAGFLAFVDGGTQGLALLGLLEGRVGILILDAAALGDERPGSVHVVRDALSCRPPRGQGAHEGNAGELLSAALLLGSLPPDVVLVGVQPTELVTRIGLSEPVRAAIPRALGVARTELARLVARWEVDSCTR